MRSEVPARADASRLPREDETRQTYVTDNVRARQQPSFQQVVIITRLNGDIV